MVKVAPAIPEETHAATEELKVTTPNETPLRTNEAPRLTEAAIRQLASPESFLRGREYCEGGAVGRLTRRGDLLEAEVEGSQYEPYQVRAALVGAFVRETNCTCRYGFGGACKHVVAALLAYLHAPESVEERPSLAALLAGFDRNQLQAILLAAAQRLPPLVDVIEEEVATMGTRADIGATGADDTVPAKRRTPVDPTPFRRQVGAALRSLDRMSGSEAYYHIGGVIAEVRRVAEQARPFLEAGDGRGALEILQAVTEEYIAQSRDIDDSDGEAGDLLADLGRLCAEAVLSANLTPVERQAWAERFAVWATEVGEYGYDDVFGAAEQAAVEGWESPGLTAWLAGEAVERDVDRLPPWDEELTRVRLTVLARQGRSEEYLKLAAATDQHVLSATMLVSLDRMAEALDHSRVRLTAADQALTVARALAGRGATAEALSLAEHGLTLVGPRVSLARWLRDLASVAERPDRALAAALVAVGEHPTLADYSAVEALAGERWPALRDELLAGMRNSRSHHADDLVDVFLHEGLHLDAVAVVNRPEMFHHYALIERVAEAVVDSQPDWVSTACRKQADWIIQGGHAGHYDRAARWLRTAGAAAAAAGHEGEWRTHVEHLIDQHRRKYKLVPLLKTLLR